MVQLPYTATLMYGNLVPEVHHASGDRTQSPLLESRGPCHLGIPALLSSQVLELNETDLDNDA